MSIQSEIARLSTNVTNTLSAIESKGVAVGAEATSDDMASLVNAIPSVSLNSYQVTLTADGWTDGVQTVSAEAATADETASHVVVCPRSESHDAYIEAGVRCSAQGDGILTFLAGSTPTEDLIVNVMILK